MNKKIKKAKERMDSFSARGSKCPICGQWFRAGCDHSVIQAKDRLLEKYIQAIVEGVKR